MAVFAVEKTKLKSHIQVIGYSPVDVGFSQNAVTEGFPDSLIISVKELAGGCLDYSGGSFGKGLVSMMPVNQQSESTTVSTDYAVIAPLPTGYAVEDRVDAHWCSVPSVV